jgi:sugar/nucleoside kinase (ribokinase family)
MDSQPSSPTVFVAGDVTFNSLVYLDSFPDPRPGTVFSRDFHETVGGTAAGKALNLNRLGCAVTLHGLIGADAYGERIRELLAQEKLAFCYDLDPQGTQRHVNLMAASGARLSIYVSYATFEPNLDLARIEELVAASDTVVINLSNYCRQILPIAQRHGRAIWCDIHDYDGVNDYHRDFIDAADTLTMSSDAMPDYRPFMEQLIAAGKRLVVCTHGAQGASALTAAGEWIETPAVTGYELRDTNGAGDAFFAGLLYGETRGYDLSASLRLGAIAGGMCITARELFAPDLSPARVEQAYRQHFGHDPGDSGAE